MIKLPADPRPWMDKHPRLTIFMILYALVLLTYAGAMCKFAEWLHAGWGYRLSRIMAEQAAQWVMENIKFEEPK